MAATDDSRGGVRRLARGVVGSFGEALGEGVLALVGLTVFAGFCAAVAYGWTHDRALTVGIAVLLGCFLSYGTWHVVRSVWAETPPRWPQLATAAAGTVLAVGFWATYVLIYR
ncbi:hypothetical protein BH10ACT10_BH10ACT10_17070 [soil metagenome]